MSPNRENAYLCPIIIGIILLFIGIFLQLPGGALTTSGYMDGEATDYYYFDNKYSAIDEYVGGDAYNYIIGASLVAGKTAGMIAAKAVLITGGLLCLCFGLTLMLYQNAEIDVARIEIQSKLTKPEKESTISTESSVATNDEEIT